MCADPSRKGRFHGSASGYGGGHDRNHAHLIVIVLLLALASMVVVPGAVLLAIPLVVILAFVLAAPAARGAYREPGWTLGRGSGAKRGRRRGADAAQYLGS